jgi:hypothetical protein
MKFFIIILWIITLAENTHAMGWGVENSSNEKFNILFTNDDDVDIVISCDERSLLSLKEEIRKRPTVPIIYANIVGQNAGSADISDATAVPGTKDVAQTWDNR